jgi:hypothetical protein
MNERRPKFPPLFDDDLALPDLAQWVAFYGGYDRITSPVGGMGSLVRGASAHAEARRSGRAQIRAVLVLPLCILLCEPRLFHFRNGLPGAALSLVFWKCHEFWSASPAKGGGPGSGHSGKSPLQRIS